MKVLEAGRSLGRSNVARGALISIALVTAVLAAGVGSPRAAGTFEPKITFETSTTQATAHPDARITIDNTASSETLKTVNLTLPKGFWGSLAAVTTKCPYATAAAGNCDPSTQVGTVKASARVDDSDVVLNGTVYLTTPGNVSGHDYTNTDPAWLSVKINPDIEGVTSFDPIITPGRVILKNRVLPVPKAGAITGPEAMQTQIGGIDGYSDIPSEVTDENDRTINFTLKKIAVDLKSDLSAALPLQPLLTNPSACGPNPVSASFSGWEGSTAPGVTDATGPYTVTGCDKVKFRPSSVAISLSDSTVSTPTGLHGDIQFPTNTASIASTKIVMPPNVSFNSLGSAFNPAFMCDASAASTLATDPNPYFIPSKCTVPETQIGTALIYSPLVPTPLKAKVMFISKGSNPSIAIYADPTTDGVANTNPEGVSIAAVGINSVKSPAPDCPLGDGCPQALQTELNVIPDAPVSRITFDIDYSPDTPRTLADSKILKVGTAGDPSCAPYSDFTAEFTSNSSTNPPGNTPVTSSYVVPQALGGCDPHTITIDGLTTEASVNLASTATPSFAFTPDGSLCVFGSVSGFGDPCTSPVSPSSSIPTGINSFAVSPDGAETVYRRYSKQTPLSLPETDTTAPTGLNFTAEPDDPTSDTTPSASYAATGAAAFQCSLNGGAFLPCGTGASGTYTVPAAQSLIPGLDTHTIAVRASDAAGNISAPISTSFEVDVPLDPTFDVDLSTTEARKHPAMDVTITSGSHEDLKDLKLDLPDGFLGGLKGVQELCSVASANASTCTSASQAGTVETEAIVDESTIRLPGKVFLTDPIQAGDPAGLYVDIPAKLQDVDMGHVKVPIRLSVRGQVKGIDSTATNLPTGIVPDNGIDGPSNFDLRKIAIKLRDNPAAEQPLLTNPSQCGAGVFSAKFTGYASTSVTKTEAFQATNCGALGFGPQLSMSLLDSKTGKPPVESTNAKLVSANLTAALTADPNGAGIQNASVLLGKAVTVNVTKLPPTCPVATYSSAGADACPAASIVGHATANSPLLRQPLSGPVYLAKSADPAIQLPRLLVALRGAINTDIFGNMTFAYVDPKVAQIRTTFVDLPDAPITTFNLNVDKVISTRNEACQYSDADSVAKTTFGGYNGAAAAAAQALPVTCKGSGTGKFKNKGKKSTLSLALRAPTGTKFRSLTVKLPKGLKYVKKGFKKGFTLKSGTKKLKYTCAKVSKTNKLTVGLCKKYNANVPLTFKAGTLTATKKVKKPKITVEAVDSLKRKYTFVVQTK